MTDTDNRMNELLKQKATDGKISCEDAWQIAEELDVAKQEVGKAADDLGLRIHSCQLGCF